MAAFEPPLDLFRQQVESLRAQTLTDWICVVSDDCSDPARFAEMRAVLDGDARFFLSRSERRRGFYHNFERALALAPRDARYVALADQDDVWDADKLETLVREIGDAQLVYSDQRIVSPDGKLLAGSYWEQRENNHSEMLSLLVANCVTGAASLFPRALLDDALPLPPAQFTHFHDHWLAVTALALGEIGYVERPLYGYVQHEQATLGHATATRRTRPARALVLAPEGPARADTPLAHALLHRRMPPAALRHRAGDALRQPDGAAQATCDRALPAGRAARPCRFRVSSSAARASWRGAGHRRSAPSGCSPTRSAGGG